MKNYKLSNKELEVMKVLWETAETLSATDIPEYNPKLNINTIQVVLRNLLKKSYIEVADIVYHNTVLTRVYKPLLTRDEYFCSLLDSTSELNNSFMAAFIKRENNLETVEMLEKLIEEQKTKLTKGEK